MKKPQQLLFLELNELNFGSVEAYVAKGHLPHFRQLLERGYARTTSETAYEELEPWIQWVTAHTGLPYAEHRIFRLGDVVKHDIPQIWETLEDKGLRVGAISPMNAKFRLRSPAFFVPDPWTSTEIHASGIDKRLYGAIREAVNENATGQRSSGSAVHLAIGGLRNAAPHNYPAYAKLLAGARKKPWNKALFLDRLLADMFVRLTRKHRPDFATLFLNAAAHIQHHYMYSSAVYDGEHANPAWYVAPGQDPVFDVYRLYDQVIGDVQRAFGNARLMIATGLHQVPYGKPAFYWRLKNHAAFLERIGVPFREVAPRMSRDFLVICEDADQAVQAERRLLAARAADGTALFEIDNRGTDLFVTMVYDRDIDAGFTFTIGNETFAGLKEDVAFVAIKNGEHDGTGYFTDTGAGTHPGAFPLSDVPRYVEAALVS
jgi:hypothetical protein